MITPLEDLYRSRTNRDRNGTIPDQWNHVLLQRDLAGLKMGKRRSLRKSS